MFVLQRDSPQVLEEAGLDGRGRICKHKLSNLMGLRGASRPICLSPDFGWNTDRQRLNWGQLITLGMQP